MMELLAANPITGVELDTTLIIVAGVAVVACVVLAIVSKFTKKK